ncbi:hypothetical protein V8E54_001588 [Elaphomyces granulatus]
MAETRKRRRLSEGGSLQIGESLVDAVPNSETAVGEPTETSTKSQLRRELFVCSLPFSVTTESLTKIFSQSYVIKHATVVVDPQTRQSRGYGFVTFADVEDAQRALEEFHGTILDGKKIRVEVAQPRHREIDEKDGKSVPSAEAARLKSQTEDLKEKATPPKLIIRNLPWSIKEPEQLAALFRSFGKVNHAVVPKKGGRQAGFGFVVLRGRKNAEKALEAVNGKEVDGRTLAVDWAVEKTLWEEVQKSDEAAEGANPAEDSATEYEDRLLKNEDPSIDSDNKSSVTEDEAEPLGDDEDDGGEDVEDPRNDSTIFIRNLPFTSTDETLYQHFTWFGHVRYARVVVDPETERPKGTGFVCFRSAEDAIACVRDAPKQGDTVPRESEKSKKASALLKSSILQNEALDPSGRYTMGDRVLQVTRAVSKTEAAKLAEEGASRRLARDKDKRRLFLLTEGAISSNSVLYKKLSPAEVKMREDSLKQRQTLIKSNPMLHLSFTRLSIRNIPRHISSKDLKALARDAIVGFAKNVKEGLRQPLSKEELKRGVEETRQAEMIRKKKGKGLVKQATIVFESRDGGKINEKSGAGRSRGYGFIEYFSHRHALMGLRWLNGHAIECVSEAGAKEKKKRLIVEFAIENAQVIRRRNQYQEKMRNLGEVGRADRKSDGRVDEDDTFLDKGNDQAKQGTKRKRSQSRSGAKDGKTDATESKDGKDLDRLAKRNRVIARKRLKRKMRKGKAS